MTNEIGFTEEELECLDTLALVWNQFVHLPELQSTHKHEFQSAIHAAQQLILSRPGKRWMLENRNVTGPFIRKVVDR